MRLSARDPAEDRGTEGGGHACSPAGDSATDVGLCPESTPALQKDPIAGLLSLGSRPPPSGGEGGRTRFWPRGCVHSVAPIIMPCADSAIRKNPDFSGTTDFFNLLCARTLVPQMITKSIHQRPSKNKCTKIATEKSAGYNPVIGIPPKLSLFSRSKKFGVDRSRVFGDGPSPPGTRTTGPPWQSSGGGRGRCPRSPRRP